ncbi:hypothetical protein [Neptunomonas qingdaonensis]|nr:hypothetical protein [Neptunomonas qingdaonensis]
MRRLLLCVLAGILPFTTVLADISTDLASEQPMAIIFNNAVEAGDTIENILGSVIKSQSGLGPEAVCTAVTLDPENAANLAEFAVNSGLTASTVVTSAMQCAPDKAPEIYTKMKELGMPEDELLASAIEAGQDPTALLEAAAAGNPIAPLVAAPGQTSLPTPLTFGEDDGGGGVASPN